MSTREQLDRQRQANRVIADQVASELEAIFFALPLGSPYEARDALLELLPLLVEKYGAIASQVAMDWYREVVPGSKPVAAPPPIPVEAIEKRVRHAAGGLWAGAPLDTLSELSSSLGKYVRQNGRDTLRLNAESDKVGWIRVPTGDKTCAFCLMLASRSADWLYNSKESALYKKDGDKYHGDCDCEVDIVRGFDDLPDGWDIDGAYEMYQRAAKEAGGRNDTTEILMQLRRLYPDTLTDGVHIDH